MSAALASFAARAADLFASRGADFSAQWLRESAAGIAAEPRALRVAFARAPRKLGREPLKLKDDELTRFELAKLLRGASWRNFDLGRVALVLAALAELEPEQHVDRISELLRGGEIGEQESLLKGLALLPEPSRFVLPAVESCRTNAACVFEAIAAENPYPAAHFPELAFNQMVLKGVFMGMSARRIVDLDKRATPELSRMALGYASEREAAQRSVPDDIAFIVSLSPPT